MYQCDRQNNFFYHLFFFNQLERPDKSKIVSCFFFLLQPIRNAGQKQYLINCFFFKQLERLDKNFIILLILEKPEACSVCKI